MNTTTDRMNAALEFLKAREQQLIDFTSDLVATPSINPPGDESQVADVVQEHIRQLGLPPAEIVAKEPHRPNLIIRIPGRRGSPVLMYSAHLDTKPVSDSDREIWDTDPLQPTIRDGRLYGLGATDMKGGVAAIIYAAASLAQLDSPLQGDLLLTLVADEEAGAGVGSKYLVDTNAVSADFCLIPEPNGVHGDFENLPLFCRGTFYFKIKVHGTQTHASIADQLPVVNASTKMAWVLWRMSQNLQLRHEPHPLCPQGPTITPGVMVDGGLYYGVHPGYAEFATDIRLVPGMTHEQVVEDINAFLDRLTKEDPDLRAELEVVGGSIQAELSGDEPFVEALLNSSERILGRRPPFGGYPAFTDAYHFHARGGIPTVPGYGPGRLTLAHGPNEWVSVQSVNEAAQMYALAAIEYLD